MSKCICEFPIDCGGLGVICCAGCGGDQCVCAACDGAGQMACDGCDYCEGEDDGGDL